MRKRMILPILLATVLLALLLHGCGKEGDSGDVGDAAQDAQQGQQNTQGSALEMGTLTAREEGGIEIAVTNEDGTQTQYVYRDVEAEEWYAEAVNYVVSTGVMSGDDVQQLFQPDYGVARAQFAVIVCRFAGGEPTKGKLSFSDLTGKEWYYGHVGWMVEQGLMGGRDGGAFDPEGFLSCEQALIVLYRLAGEPDITGTLEGYPYAPKVSDSGHDAVTWAWNNGLITEKECVWYPTQAVSRAQVALLLMRYAAMMQ